MSSAYSVTVLCPNGRRAKISASHSKLLREILDEACLSHGYDPDTHDLKHHGRILDGSLSFRLSGLPNNATLELVETPEKSAIHDVEIALQLPTGKRLQKKFPNSVNLSALLIEFSKDAESELSKPSDPIEIPVLTYMNKQWKALELSNATLKSIGINSGKAMLRYGTIVLSKNEKEELEQKQMKEIDKRKKLEEAYSRQKAENDQRAQLEAQREEEVIKRHKLLMEEKDREVRQTMKASKSDQPMEIDQPRSIFGNDSQTAGPSVSNRMDHLQTILNAVNSSLSRNSLDFLPDRLVSEDGRIHLTKAANETSTVLESTPDFSNFKFPDTPITTVGAIMKAENQAKLQKIPTKPDRRPILFKRVEAANVFNEDVSAEFFDLTVDDAKALQKSLREEVRISSQRALLPKSFIEQKNKELKESAYRNTVVRFLLNDWIVQACFYSKESVSRLYEFVEELLLNKQPFELVLIPNLKLISSNVKTLLDESIAPKSTVVIKLSTQSCDYYSLLDRTNISEGNHEEAEKVCKEWLKVNNEFRPYNPVAIDETTTFKRTASPMSADIEEPQVRRKPPETNLPKWFKK